MGQIEKRKKKGRPSKADLAARLAAASVEASPAPASDSDRRRSLRRRSFRYNIIDYDEDYLDDDEDNVEVFEDEDDDEERDEEDEEDEEEDGGRRRREKKVKLVVKLSNGRSGSRGASRGRGRVDSASRTSRRGRVGSQGDEEEEDEEEERVVKKRRINAREDEDEEEEVEEEEEEENNGGGNCEDEERDGKVESKRGNCDIGTPVANNHRRSGTPLPDKKQLELILDKLQKKDTYGVYAEPVDPEELPDYHDIIEHPMDFSTVRKKLANGSYSTLEQFEAFTLRGLGSDVFLISSNAMQYNAPETIYHKQARAIKELAERKFQRVRIQIERLEESKSEAKGEVKSETKPEQRERCNLLLKKITKKPPSRITQEPVGSDFFSGATLATTDAQNSQNAGGADLVGNFERNSNNEGPVEGISSVVENYVEKAEDVLSGKGVLPKFGRRSFVVDENRRATYNMSNQPVDRSDSIFIPFEDEKKQLIPVGLAGEYSYARSLARFVANLGPIAWRIASKRIEQVLPPGFKYGRGWVGEFEPLPTAVLVLKGHKEYPLVSTLHDAADSGKNDKLPECITPAREQLSNQSRVDAKMPSIFGSGGTKPPTPTISIAEQRNLLPRASGGPESAMLKRAALSSSSPKNQHGGAAFQRQHLPRDSAFAENMGVKRVEPNTPVYSQKMNYLAPKQAPIVKEMDANRMETHCSPVSDRRTDLDAPKQLPGGMELPTSRPVMAIHESKDFLQSFSFKQPDSNGGASEGLHNSNGKNVNNFVDSNRVIVSSPASIPTQLSGAAASFPQRQDHGVSDPVLVMKMLTEKAQRQQNGSIYVCSPSPARPSIPSPRGDSGSNAAAAAASAWMSVGAVGFRPAAQTPPGNRAQLSADPHGGKQMFHPQSMQSHVEYPGSATMHFRPEKNGLPFQAFVQQPVKANNEPPIQNRPMAFPPSGTNDLSRFQVQASWRGLRPHTQQKQNQDTLPPDLNVAFQSVDSQQPDLALQL